MLSLACNNSTKRLTLTGAPDPTLRTWSRRSLDAVVTRASTTSETNVKSLVCSPSPTMVRSWSASICARNTPNTAP